MKCFVRDCCKTVQARVVIFGKQVDNDVLYRGIVNQPSHAFFPRFEKVRSILVYICL